MEVRAMRMSKDGTTARSTIDELMETFEKMSPEERRRDIARTEATLRANNVRTLSDLDRFLKINVTE
jgi:molybdopterin converting factor small subunit